MTSAHRRAGLRPRLVVVEPGPEGVREVILVLPGGRAHSRARFRPTHLANLRMLPFAWAARERVRPLPVAVWRLEYRFRGWNAPLLDPVLDTRWALAEVRRCHPGAHVVLVGHSMGGRTALRCAGDTTIVGVCVFAPWLEPDEPVEQLAGCTVLIAHGDQDRITDPQLSHRYAERAATAGADVCFQYVHGDGHAMLRRAGRWNALLKAFIGALVEDAAPVSPSAPAADLERNRAV